MPAGALAFTLVAALAHATWNVLLGRARDAQAATAIGLTSALLLFAPVAIATGGVTRAAAPYVAASACLHLTYFALLGAGYGAGQVSVIYPVARGSAPVLVLVVGVLALGVGASAGQVAGVALVATGVVAVGRPGRHGSRRDVAYGLAVGACIAAYTLVDKSGLERARPIAYLELLLAGSVLPYLAALIGLGRGRALRAELGPASVAIGVLAFGAYALVLAALRIAPAASVAAVRESSVVIAALLAAALLDEPVGPLRLGGAALVTIGICAIALA